MRKTVRRKTVRGVTICKACRFAERVATGLLRGVAVEDKTPTGYCLSTDAPISNYVDGLKGCAAINKDGDCEFFWPLK